MRFTTEDGLRLSYERMGTGPVLVVHPGGPGFSTTYLGDLAGLGDRHTLVMLSPRGTGASDRPADPAAYRLDDYVSDLDALREHLGLEQMLLLGYSHGGVVAQAYASAHPQRVSRLVLAVTLARFGPEQEAATKAGREKRSGADWYPDAMAASEEELGTATDEQVRDNAMRGMPFYFARFGPAEAAYVDTFCLDPINGDAQRAFGSELPGLDLRSSLANITAPTLVITGEDDFICGPVCADEISAAIRGSREVIVPDAGHMLVFEQRRIFHDEIANFLAA
ncbi:MAG TPA: alpha/beta hydrolase [Candidatus Dormibacteraeota bacterium]|nr:alpha/beta hydrolase [Candidatus Dormibacteraeota bacterium]